MQKVVDGAKIGIWACVNFCHDLSQDQVRNFCNGLGEWSTKTGVVNFLYYPFYLCCGLNFLPVLSLFPFDLQDFRGAKLKIVHARPEQVEDELRKVHLEARSLKTKIDLLVAILPDKNGTLYGNMSCCKLNSLTDLIFTYPLPGVIFTTGNIKKICETDIGLMSQCCLNKNVLKASPQFFANVALKINAKVTIIKLLFNEAFYSSFVIIYHVFSVWGEELSIC